jgi:anti-anti-sigma factor
MQITVAEDQSATVLRLVGRFDGDGAAVFDAFIEQLDRPDDTWILDCSDVRYISSMGLRSLVRVEKRLRLRDGRLVLANLARPVRQVLEMARLHEVFRLATSVADAVAMARAGSIAPERAIRSAHQGRPFALWPLSGRSVLETWGLGPTSLPARVQADDLSTVTLEDLGIALGFGGFGVTREQACEAAGALFTLPTFAALKPTGANATDFVVPERPADAVVHVASALGISGSPDLAMRVSVDAPFPVTDLVDGVLALSPPETATPAAVTAILAIVDLVEQERPAILLMLAADRMGLPRAEQGFHALAEWLPPTDRSGPTLCTGRAALLASASALPRIAADPVEVLSRMATLDSLDEIVEVDCAWRITNALVWVYHPTRIREGREKQLTIDVDDGAPMLDEWETIARRLYRDCRRIVLTPLHGGFMSSTFRVASYDADGRRLLPTVLKIGGVALTEREEVANRKYVQTFILNNSTTLLGGAAAGEWAGLRYNFLGVTGPDSSLVWLRDLYLRRSAAEVLPLFDTLFTRVLKPWYGQPRWESVALYADHDPRRLFPALCEASEQVLGVSADSEFVPCPELQRDLLNPFYFLQHGFPRRRQRSRLWYTAICHGDLNMQNVLVDERQNIYVIDFSETRPRNVVSDFARLEPILKFEMIPIEGETHLREMLQFEQGLLSAAALDEMPPFTYP